MTLSQTGPIRLEKDNSLETADLRSLRICMIGLRGIPDVQGGVEKHVEQLVPHLVDMGADVHVFARRNYVDSATPYRWGGVTVHPLWAPRSTRFEAIVHTLLALLKARSLKPDVVHIHAVGPSLVAPVARLLGLRVVFTHHGYDYDREKWNALEKKILRLGEWAGMRFSHGRIAVAKHISDKMQETFGKEVHFIPNGVQVNPDSADAAVLDEFGLKKGQYVLLVARIVAEKRQADLLKAFNAANLPGVKLVLVGGGDVGSTYVDALRAQAAPNPAVVLTGPQSGARLAGLFANAGLFVLPSSHEGMPIALLEALAYGIPVLASDIEANLALELEPCSYFPLGDVNALAAALSRKLATSGEAAKARSAGRQIISQYSWRSICLKTASVYLSVVKKARSG